MRCPKCKQFVDPLTDEKWVDVFLKEVPDRNQPDPLVVLKLIDQWDRSAMWTGGQSILPTELRDAVRRALINAGTKPAE